MGHRLQAIAVRAQAWLQARLYIPAIDYILSITRTLLRALLTLEERLVSLSEQAQEIDAESIAILDIEHIFPMRVRQDDRLPMADIEAAIMPASVRE